MSASGNSIAIGRNAVCTASNAVAIGSGALAFDPVAAWGEDRVINNWVDDLNPGDLFYIENDPERPCVFLGYGRADAFPEPFDVIIAMRRDGVVQFALFSHVPDREIVILSRLDEPSA